MTNEPGRPDGPLPEDIAALQAFRCLPDRRALSSEAYEAAGAALLNEAADAPQSEPDSSPPQRLTWEPESAAESTAPELASGAPPAKGGAEMLERLRDRGFISQGEYEESRVGLPPAPTPPPPVDAPQPAAGPPTWAPPPRERYPMRFDVEYPDRLSRWKTFFRAFLIIPVGIFGQLLQTFVYIALFIGFTTVFGRKKYPDWLFRGLSGAYGFGARSYAYVLLVTDRFPSFAPEDSPVTLEYDQPPSGELSRWRVLFWKGILLIPQLFVLEFLWLATWVVSVIAWFGILFTGNYPRGLFQFTVGVQRWTWRTAGYFSSFNDRYPPYSLSADAGPASNGATVANGVIGGLVVAGYAALIATAVALSGDYQTERVSYADVRAGRDQPLSFFAEDYSGRNVALELSRAVDPGNNLVEVIRPSRQERIIVFQWSVENSLTTRALVADDAATLKFSYRNGDSVETDSVAAVLITVNNKTAPANVPARGSATIQAVFVVPVDATPMELRFRGGFAGGGVKYIFN